MNRSGLSFTLNKVGELAFSPKSQAIFKKGKKIHELFTIEALGNLLCQIFLGNFIPSKYSAFLSYLSQVCSFCNLSYSESLPDK